MPLREGDAAYLWDMLEAARSVLLFVGDRTFDEYLEDQILQAAVERKIEILGEAARKISDEFKHSHQEFPWRRIIGQRHVLAHEYGEIDHKIVWLVVKVHLPELIERLEGVIPSIPEEDT